MIIIINDDGNRDDDDDNDADDDDNDGDEDDGNDDGKEVWCDLRPTFLLFTSSPKQLRQSNKLSARTCSYLIFVSFFLSYFSHSFYESSSIHLPLFFFYDNRSS